MINNRAAHRKIAQVGQDFCVLCSVMYFQDVELYLECMNTQCLLGKEIH